MKLPMKWGLSTLDRDHFLDVFTAHLLSDYGWSWEDCRKRDDPSCAIQPAHRLQVCSLSASLGNLPASDLVYILYNETSDSRVKHGCRPWCHPSAIFSDVLDLSLFQFLGCKPLAFDWFQGLRYQHFRVLLFENIICVFDTVHLWWKSVWGSTLEMSVRTHGCPRPEKLVSVFCVHLQTGFYRPKFSLLLQEIIIYLKI